MHSSAARLTDFQPRYSIGNRSMEWAPRITRKLTGQVPPPVVRTPTGRKLGISRSRGLLLFIRIARLTGSSGAKMIRHGRVWICSVGRPATIDSGSPMIPPGRCRISQYNLPLGTFIGPFFVVEISLTASEIYDKNKRGKHKQLSRFRQWGKAPRRKYVQVPEVGYPHGGPSRRHGLWR